MHKLPVSGVVCLVSLWFSVGIFLGLPGATWLVDLATTASVANASSLAEFRRGDPYSWGTVLFYVAYLPVLVGVAVVSFMMLLGELLYGRTPWPERRFSR